MMLKLLLWPLWVPLYVLTTLDRAAGNKKAGWTVEDSNVFFGTPYNGRKFYEPANPLDDDEQKELRVMKHAASFNIGYCSNPQCRSVHIMLYDEAGEAFASAEVSDTVGPDIIKRLQDALYARSASHE